MLEETKGQCTPVEDEPGHAAFVASDAIRYNRNIPREALQRVQMALGLDPDGLTSLETAEAVLAFQGLRGIEEDGKAGPETQRHINDYILSLDWAGLRNGVWADIHPRYFARNADAICMELKRLGINFVQIMLNRSGQPTFKSLWSPSRLRAVTTSMKAAGVSCGYTIWAYSSRQFTNSLEALLPECVDANKADWELLEPDNEGYVSPRLLRPKKVAREFGSIEEFNDELDRILTKEAKRVGAKLGSTPHRYAVSGETNKPRINLSAEIGGRLTMQAYSESEAKSGKSYDPFSFEGPMREQFICIKRAKEIMNAETDGYDEPPEITEIGVGTPLFDQGSWSDGRDGVRAIVSAEETCLVHDVKVTCRWSLKFLIGRQRSATAVAACEEIARRKLASRRAA